MNKTEFYKGVFPAFYACYDKEGNISSLAVKNLSRHLLKEGVQGLYVNGSSGECIYLSVDERKKVLESVMDEVGGKMRIIVHVACNNTKDSQELARHAQSLGADAIAAIPPIYFHLPDYAIEKYWNDISQAAPEEDFFLYNIPQLAGTALTSGLLKKMLKNPKVVGVKNSSLPSQDIQIWKAIGGKDFVVMNGPDEQFISGIAMGATGGIGGTYAVMPRLFLKAYSLMQEGKVSEARKMQNTICRIIAKMCSGQGSMYAVAKDVLKRQGVECGSVRAPMPPLSQGDLKIAEQAFVMIQKALEAL